LFFAIVFKVARDVRRAQQLVDAVRLIEPFIDAEADIRNK
jgi:hypothetical protein